MENSKHKILVLSNLNETTNNTLKSSIRLAKVLDSSINFLYVKKPTEVVKTESQLSAIRTINKEYSLVGKDIKNLIDPISKEYNVNINHSFIIGNIKNEIENYIENNKPDVIVLGKGKFKRPSFIGNSITEFILKKYKGTIVIADDKNTIEPNDELSLGLFNNINSINKFTESLINSTKKPLASFKTIKDLKALKEESFLADKETVEYVFDEAEKGLKSVSSCLSKSNTNLLFVNREGENSTKKNIKDLIKNTDCSLILTT
jgi:hypothetical protein